MLEFIILTIVMMGVSDLVSEPNGYFCASKIFMYLAIISIFITKMGINFGLMAFLIVVTLIYMALLFFSNKNKLLFAIDTIIFLSIIILASYKVGTMIW